jgi:hypothetical protein
MSYVKKLIFDENKSISQLEFNNYWNKLNEMYDRPEEMMNYSEIADLMNFEFDLLLSDIDVKKFRDGSKLIEEEDMELIYKNVGVK